MKKVCHVSSGHTGLDIRIFQKECVTLNSAGYQVHFISNLSNENVIDAKKIGVNAIKLPISNNRFEKIIKLPFKCLKICLGVKPDIVHLHDPALLPMGVLLRLLGYSVIYDVHEDTPKDILYKNWLPKIFRPVISKLVGLVELLASRILVPVCATPEITSRFLKYTSNAINVNNYPIVRNTYEKKQSKPNKVCYLGAISRVRGIFEVLDAIWLLAGQVELELAGKFESEAVKKSVMKHPAMKFVNFYGQVSVFKVREILSTSTVGLVTLHPTETFKTSLPIKLFEYMEMQIPVIASNFEYWKPLVIRNNCGVIVDPLSPDDIANKIKYFIDHPDEAINKGLNGRIAVIDKYNWSTEAKKLLQLYARI